MIPTFTGKLSEQGTRHQCTRFFNRSNQSFSLLSEFEKIDIKDEHVSLKRNGLT